MPNIDLNSTKWELQHRKHVEQYLSEIDALYDAALAELIRLGVSYNYDPSGGRIFTFSQNKSRQKQAEQIVSSFSEKMKGIITAGVATEWAFANDKTDSWVKALFSSPKRGWMLHNLEVLKAFQRRKSNGHTLSDRVWFSIEISNKKDEEWTFTTSRLRFYGLYYRSDNYCFIKTPTSLPEDVFVMVIAEPDITPSITAIPSSKGCKVTLGAS